MYEIKVDETETQCPQCGKPLRAIKVRQSGSVSTSVFEAILADHRGAYPRISVDAAGWLLAEECQNFHIIPPPIPSLETDRATLVAFYYATNGPNWIRSDNWLSDAPISEWFGVKTNAAGRVIDLFIRCNRLKGEIPKELGNLDNLTGLCINNESLGIDYPPRIDYNQLSGEIPRELGNLVNLTHLDLSFNRLSGEIPRELGNLTNLERLDLGRNQLNGKIPRELGNLVNLTHLDLSFNRLSGEIPRELCKLTNLEWLDLNDNQLAGEIPRELGNLVNLETLCLNGNQLTGCIPGNLQDKLLTDSDLLFLGTSDLGGLPFCPE